MRIVKLYNLNMNIDNLRTCVYQGVRNVSFSENFAYVLNGWTLSLFRSASDM